MKTIFSILWTAIGIFTFAQVSVSGKAHLLFPTSTANWQSIKNSTITAYENRGKNNIGFNAGLSVKADLAKSFFIMPELYYSSFKNEFVESTTNTTLEVKNNRMDFPVLLGYHVVGNHFSIFAGPVASYLLEDENQYNDFIENSREKFTVGYQVGAEFKLSKLSISGRYEGAFSQEQVVFMNSNTGLVVQYDNRPSLFLAGIGLEF